MTLQLIKSNTIEEIKDIKQIDFRNGMIVYVNKDDEEKTLRGTDFMGGFKVKEN